MPRPPEEVRRRLDELISRCDVFLPPQERLADGGFREPRKFTAPKSELWRFLISSLQTVTSACGRDSPHLRELERCREQFASVSAFGEGRLDLDSCRGALEAARDDLDAGMLTDLRQLVTAEAFGDLLETAVHLLEEKHHLAAVAVGGAVLESSLRNLAASKKIPWSGPSSISKINTEIYKANVYDKVVWAEIEGWGRLRNQVDHGDFRNPEDVDAGAAKRMVDGVRDFAMKYR